MSLKSRVSRLSRNLQPDVCPACRDRRGGVVIVAGHNGRHGTFVPDRPPPEPCAICGEVPEKLLVIVEGLVSSDGRVLAWEDWASQASQAAMSGPM
jgi:hypothetical protein